MTSSNATLDILLPLPFADGFEYRGDPSLIHPGALVEVPFGQRSLTGLVLGAGMSTVAPGKLKDINATLPLPPLPEAFCQFLRWAAHYTMTPPGLMLKMTMAGVNPPPPPAEPTGWRRSNTPLPDRAKPGSKAAQLLALFSTPEQCITVDDLAAVGLTTSDAQALVKRGIVERVACPDALPSLGAQPHPPTLNPAQYEAANELIAAFAAPQPILLQGVTGSGKTEVYSEAIATAMQAGKQSVVLMPEIALTSAMLERFTRRFGFAPTLWHSGLSAGQRRANWWAIARGQAQLVLGARSALFLPYPNLGLIIVDEEHEAAYKQEDGAIYHARDMAVARAHHGKIPVILASATPSLESQVNVMQGRYHQVKLPARFGGAQLPRIHRIDMRAEKLPASRFLSAPLVTALQETLAAGEQAMLFLNRRGYAPLTLCRSCGHRLQCPQCSAWLVLHKQRQRLQCHHCGVHAPLPPACPACRNENQFAACGPGVERVAEEVHALLPKARTAIMASDLVDTPQAVAALLEQMTSGEVDILIGTQIMAKGYHFPNLTLVGIVDGDLGLSGGDPRASERCYQLLHQVAGRSGRAEKPGRAYLQTFQPDHPVMQALTRQDEAAFIAAELQERAAYDLPPYKRLAALILSGTDQTLVQATANLLAQAIPQDDAVRLLGPAPAMLALLRGQHRMRLLLITDKNRPPQPILRTALQTVSLPKSLKLQIDIDPYSFF